MYYFFLGMFIICSLLAIFFGFRATQSWGKSSMNARLAKYGSGSFGGMLSGFFGYFLYLILFLLAILGALIGFVKMDEMGSKSEKISSAEVATRNNVQKIHESQNNESKKSTTNDIEWTKQIRNDASIDFTQTGLILRVNKTSIALARMYLPNIVGNVSLNFDYEIQSDGWWEIPGVSISNQEASAFSLSNCNHELNSIYCGNLIAVGNKELKIKEFGSQSGSFKANFNIPEKSSINFFIIPSQYSNNSDHGNTVFKINNLRIDIQ